ncbi:unnamed protein product [Soboliphyme baturini]|uniref:SpoU_methylase domain-containing protein n=1 Tax=Soboliphyme baturini TaxID=241478 RepID=A0A183J8R1_9BILA|nr:unnamed protein product [Soboliphyme baturini]
MGGHFRVPIYDDILWDDMEQHLPNEFTYHEEQFFPRPTTVLVVGNESVGLSKASYGFAHKHGGKRVHIPLMNGVNSLNSVTAISIIAYEFRRQMYAFEDGLQALESSSSELG